MGTPTSRDGDAPLARCAAWRVASLAAVAIVGTMPFTTIAQVVPLTPPGSVVSARYVAVDPNAAGTVYVATYQGDPRFFPGATVFKSTDGGASWADVGQSLPHHGTIDGIALDRESVVYCYATTDGVYRSHDGGTSWQLLGPVTSVDLVADSSAAGTLYAYLYGITKTTDGGVTWLDASTGLGEALPGEPGPSVSTLAIDPSSPSTLYAGRWEKGIYKSTDGGMHWQALDMGFKPSGIVSIAVDPNSSSVVFAGTAEDGLFKSTDGGAQWASVRTGQPNLQVFALAFDKESILYAGIYDFGVLVSRDGGNTWTDATPALPSNFIRTLVADPATSGRIYAGSTQ
jgi:photosystem II stability/assembly factor-like uncharacterized protein